MSLVKFSRFCCALSNISSFWLSQSKSQCLSPISVPVISVQERTAWGYSQHIADLRALIKISPRLENLHGRVVLLVHLQKLLKSLLLQQTGQLTEAMVFDPLLARKQWLPIVAMSPYLKCCPKAQDLFLHISWGNVLSVSLDAVTLGSSLSFFFLGIYRDSSK